MDTIQTALGFVSGGLLKAGAFLFVLGLVILVHELGHYWAGRSVGVHSVAFSLGFGPELFGWTDKRGTRWKVSLIPLGGYVKFLGDEDEASKPDNQAVSQMSAEDKARSLAGKSVGRRAWVVFAGPFANFVFSIVIFAVLFMTMGKTVVTPRIKEVLPDGAAYAAGLKAGDIITRIENTPIVGFDQVQRMIGDNAGVALRLEIDREGQKSVVTLTPKLNERRTIFGIQRTGLIGVIRTNDPADIRHVRFGPIEAVTKAGQETYYIVDRTLTYLGGLIAGQEKADQLSGPLRIAHVAAETSEHGLPALISLAALLSVSVGLLNLLPIPVLDGGHLAFYAYEAVFRRPPSERVQEVSFRIGIAFVVSLMLFATWNDIAHFLALSRGG